MSAAMTSFERARERESAAKPALRTELVRWSDGDGTRACQVSQEWCAEGTTSGGGEGRSSEGAWHQGQCTARAGRLPCLREDGGVQPCCAFGEREESTPADAGVHPTLAAREPHQPPGKQYAAYPRRRGQYVIRREGALVERRYHLVGEAQLMQFLTHRLLGDRKTKLLEQILGQLSRPGRVHSRHHEQEHLMGLFQCAMQYFRPPV